MNFKKIKIIGDTMLDQWLEGSYNKISSEAPINIFQKKKLNNSLGGAGNLCVNLKSLGIKFKLYSEIGKDKYGKEVKKILKDKNISFDLVKKKKQTTIKKRYFISGNQIFREDKEDIKINKIIGNRLLKNLKSNDIVVFSDYNKGSIYKNLHSKVIKKKCITFIDPKNNPNFYKNAFLVKPNMEKFTEWCGKFSRKKAFKLLKTMKWTWLVVSNSKNGVHVFNKLGKYNYYRVKDIKEPNVVGAGDIFFSGIIFKYLINLDLFTAVELASYAATKCVNKKKIRNINKDDFKKDLVFTNGVFDILHKGHVDLLKFCKKIGKKTVVGINIDKSVKNIKGNDRPFNNLKIRIRNINKTKLVDKIISFKESNPLRLINSVKPDVIVKGSDYKFNQIVGSKNYNALIFKIKKKISTTKILENLNKIE